jgi:type VI secretion system secreted protein Hcp
MSGDIFLKLKDVEDEGSKKGHEKEIEVESFSWGESNPTSFAHASGGGVGKVAIQDVHFTKLMSKSSANLAQFCASGKHISEAVFTFRKAGEDPQEYLKVKLTDVMISSYQLSDSSGGSVLPHESISLAAAKVQFEYYPQDEKGKLGAKAAFGWDVSKHKEDKP